jgi:glycosyltransferase involved in cell wall biosynthesis
MCASDVLSHPSRWEGLGGVPIEAMALRLPVVASNIAALREALEDAAFAYVAPEDPDSLAAALSAAFSNREQVVECIAKGARRFETYFASDAVADRMRDFYERTLGS